LDGLDELAEVLMLLRQLIELPRIAAFGGNALALVRGSTEVDPGRLAVALALLERRLELVGGLLRALLGASLEIIDVALTILTQPVVLGFDARRRVDAALAINAVLSIGDAECQRHRGGQSRVSIFRVFHRDFLLT